MLKFNNSTILTEGCRFKAQIDGVLKYMSKLRSGFTLAEVLITLGVIGVISAMTIPNLITKYQKITVEVKLKKFYSTINQAARMIIAEHGDLDGIVDYTKEYNYNQNLEFVNTYIAPYLKNLQVYPCGFNNAVCILMYDGSAIYIRNIKGIDMIWATTHKRLRSESALLNKHLRTHEVFIFNFSKVTDLSTNARTSNYVAPYVYDWDGSIDGPKGLKTHPKYGCNNTSINVNFCTKLIQLNSWKIPDDYPW